MIRILLADDHAILRGGLKFYINSIITGAVIDEASDAGTVLKKIKQTGYDLIVLDTSMDGKESYELVTDIITMAPGSNILIFGMYGSMKEKKYLQLGANGFISKTASGDEIKNKIKSLLNKYNDN